MFGWFSKLINPARDSRKRLGNAGEECAAQFLEKQGYQILDRQARWRFGEIDLIALHVQIVVFVEVKTRSSLAAGHPTESITKAKQNRITRSALRFLKRRRWLNRAARFDVVSIIWPANGGEPLIQHYLNAFEPTGFGQFYS